MANATVSRPGQSLGAGDAEAMFRDVFSGEVLTAFEEKVNLKDKQRIRNIDHGKSASFAMTYKAGTSYHVPGEEILGQTIQHAEKTITLDNKLISDAFIADIDEAKNHYEYRSIYSNEMGVALANAYDKNVARNIVLASRGAHTFQAGYDDGNKLTNANYGTDASLLFQALLDAQQAMEEKDVNLEASPVFAAFKPAQWYLLSQLDKIINKDYNSAGDVKTKNLTTINDVTVIKSNAYPWGTNDTANTAIPSDYRADFTNTVGTVWTPEAVGTLHLMDLSMQMQEDVRRQGTLMVGRYAVGHGILRNQCAVELATL